MNSEEDSIDRAQKLQALKRVGRYNPALTLLIIAAGVLAALLEGIGLGFILPIVEIMQNGPSAADSGGAVGLFLGVYKSLGIPFTLLYVILGVIGVMVVRYGSTFMVAWAKASLETNYIRYLQSQTFEKSLDAEVAYFDQKGSDNILNAIVTQAEYAGNVIRLAVNIMEMFFLSSMYLLVAFLISPPLTFITILTLGGITYVVRYVVEPGYDLGDAVADANERLHQAAQAGTQGIREVKTFGMKKDVLNSFQDAVDQFLHSTIKLRKNEAEIQNFYSLAVAVTLFSLIYFAVTIENLSLGSLGIFLFAMFRLGPQVSNLNKQFYKVENNLPHLVRTQQFVEELEDRREPSSATEDPPESIETTRFLDVHFSYGEEEVLKGLNFEVQKDEFVAFVGQSGAGKSTIAALLARLYEPDEGEILANDIPIHQIDIDKWRSKVSIVRQDPFIFNDTLRYNLNLGDDSIPEEALDEVCQIARVDEFLNELPQGYDTQLGDKGVKLSGGQRQRVAIARALLKKADILILDEATSDLDTNLENQVHSAIEDMARDYAVIAIAHRLSTVKNSDRIYTIEDGEITEQGPHEDLVQNGGIYAELYSHQAHGAG